MRAPVRARIGGGAAAVNPTQRAPSRAEPARRSKPSVGRRGNGLGALRRARRKAPARTAHALQAHPVMGPCGGGRLRSAPDARWSTGCLGQAGARWHLASTARASVWARTVSAWPFPCVCSKGARDCGPGGGWRRQTTAASAKAHVRDAGPRCVPVGPARCPADAVAHVTRRPEDTHSCPRGQRAMAWIASTGTRRRSGPMPGPVWSRERGWALGCGAVCTMAHARACSRWSS
jgi:hypothetical protein